MLIVVIMVYWVSTPFKLNTKNILILSQITSVSLFSFEILNMFDFCIDYKVVKTIVNIPIFDMKMNDKNELWELYTIDFFRLLFLPWFSGEDILLLFLVVSIYIINVRNGFNVIRHHPSFLSNRCLWIGTCWCHCVW